MDLLRIAWCVKSFVCTPLLFTVSSCVRCPQVWDRNSARIMARMPTIALLLPLLMFGGSSVCDSATGKTPVEMEMDIAGGIAQPVQSSFEHLQNGRGVKKQKVLAKRMKFSNLHAAKRRSISPPAHRLSVQKVSKPTTQSAEGLYTSFSGLARVSEKLICILRALHEYVNFAAPDPYEFFRLRVIARMHVW